MPMFATRSVAQRVRHPNGTSSDPFIASASKLEMLSFDDTVHSKPVL